MNMLGAEMVKVGDAVRLKPGSELRELFEPWAEAVWRVARTYREADGLRIAVALGDPGQGYTSPMPAEEFELDTGR